MIGQVHNLAQTLKNAIKNDGRSLITIAFTAQVDQGYVSRLQNGEKEHPSRDVVIRLGLTLLLPEKSAEEMFELFQKLDGVLLAADYSGLTTRRT
jgi:hypothetical protein